MTPNAALHEPVAHATYVLLQEHGAELLQAGRRIVQRSDDRLPLGNGQPEHTDAAAVTVLETDREVGVLDEAGELQDEVLVSRPARDRRASRRSLLVGGVLLIWTVCRLARTRSSADAPPMSVA